ncbi:HlyD family efflux transporter periplasmic adaptor subunit [Paludisphaera soli]|uniref:HlyD family efflux transporter periplasmic adaptor subunit n=1 Tax=Paludisphaera soli TaxID=2712865 RepID=UPI0013ECC789|nr:HlyD family efflux transporter periplasmic adaptor subunit [Paludisphaera soli]
MRASLYLVVLIVTSSAVRSATDDPAPAETAEARAGRVRVTVRANGVLRPSHRHALTAPSEGSATVLAILPEGTKVGRGQPVCRLDASAATEPLIEQMRVVQKAESAWLDAQLAREVAEIAVTEYEVGIYPQDRESANGSIRLAEAALADAEKAVPRAAEELLLARLRAMPAAGSSPVALLGVARLEDRLTLADLELQKARFAVEQAKSKLAVLEKYTHPKKRKELRAAVEKAKTVELTAAQDHELAREKLAILQRQVDACTLVAPADGIVVEADDPPRVGSVVGPGRVLAYVQGADGRMGVSVAIPEHQAELITRGLPTRVTLPGSGPPLAGNVAAITKIAEDGATAEIALTDPLPPTPIGPGMKVDVELTVESPEAGPVVPARAMVWFDGAYRLGVVPAEGDVTWREVEPGLTDGTNLKIASGLAPGEAVVVEPLSRLSEDQRRMFAIAPPPAAGGRRTALAASLLRRLPAPPPDRRGRFYPANLDRLGLDGPERALLREFAEASGVRDDRP